MEPSHQLKKIEIHLAYTLAAGGKTCQTSALGVPKTAKKINRCAKIYLAKNIDNDLRPIKMSFDEARNVSKDRKEWRYRIGHAT